MEFDVNSISQVLDLAGKAFTTSNQGASAARSIKELLSKSKGGGDADVKAAMADLIDQISNAAVANAELKMQLADLHTEALKADKFEAERQRYSLWQTPRGDFVYRLDEAKANGQPLHYICPNCVEQRQVTILQGGPHTIKCNRCPATFRVTEPPAPIVRTSSIA